VNYKVNLTNCQALLHAFPMECKNGFVERYFAGLMMGKRFFKYRKDIEPIESLQKLSWNFT